MHSVCSALRVNYIEVVLPSVSPTTIEPAVRGNSLTTNEPSRNAFAMLLCRWKGCQSAGEKIQFIADDDGLEKNFIDCAYFFTKNVIVRTIGYTVTLKA